ncbi:serine/threonine-protein kinase Nek10 isoform X2 [Girardinichthys multiradiatus]|uniref:serine/threonine-protein kinase Nek10 isoform X2 n=1 Tax=Girardinichthys multiradiatus TaxID=208333 RepID=UPI001FADF2FF|nr:serine/threonine-protein kinase Nek10 isoform X2 [Girardinichthys multiradiatus]
METKRKMLKMSNLAKKVRPAEKLQLKSTTVQSKAFHDLRRLLSLLAKSSSRQEMSTLSNSKAVNSRAIRCSHSPKHNSRPRSDSDPNNEVSQLEKFSIAYKDQRCFSSHPLSKLFLEILTSLVKNRLCSEWIDHASPEAVHRVLICLRLLIRDPNYQEILHQLEGISLLARYMESVTAKYISCGEEEFDTQKLVTMTYIFQKLSSASNQRLWVIETGAHRTLAKLLSTTDCGVLQGALFALTALAESTECRTEIGEPQIVDSLLVILQEYDLLSKRMSAELLRLLCSVQHVRDQLKEIEGVPVLLSLLHSRNLKLLWSVTWVVVQLCEDPDCRAEIRGWGGVQQLLRLLNIDRQHVSDRSAIEMLPTPSNGPQFPREHMSEELGPHETVQKTVALQSACCTALTELSLDDTSAHDIVQENGIYIIANLILPKTFTKNGPKAGSLQCYAFRALRFLFSVERNRYLFKRLFPTDFFELFIDVGHYVRDLTAYEELQTQVSLYSEEELNSLRENIEALDQNRPPLRVIGGYSILDHLGSGAFGSVFKVQKHSRQNLLALKEVNLHNPVFGKDKKSRDSNVEKIISELTIIKEQMTHPNIVKYCKTFLEGDKLYIVMELIEGLPLAQHFNSLKDKQQTFTEDRIWNIFIQMCLALRYLHKEKRIVHRDLSPNNIMLGEKDKVTITDFGLAKQKQENSELTSVVGTILYSCPEVVQNKPYGEKADIWALGCILYQMATLQPPFYSSNMLSLASMIVEGVYEPVEEGAFSERLTGMIRWCLSSDPEQRPDIIAVSSRISDIMMRLMDGLYTSQNALQRRADNDRKRTQKYFLERQQSRNNYCHSDMERGLTQTESVARSSSAGCGACDILQTSSEDLEPRVCVTPVQIVACGDFTASKIKPRPVSVGICVSQKKLRQIDDPIQRLLVQLHKIIFITQLPPASHHSIKRHLVERFKKSLFQVGSDPYNIKVELSKAIIEELLEENSYYEATNSRAKDKRNNLAGNWE